MGLQRIAYLVPLVVLASCGGSSEVGGPAPGGTSPGGSSSAGGAGGIGASGKNAGGTIGFAGSSSNGGTSAGGSSTSAGGSSTSAGGNGLCGTSLIGVLRDFKEAHPDFEYKIGDDKGIVKPDLGADQKPVYASTTTTPTTNGKASFDQWYRDVPGTNLSSALTLQLLPGAAGVFTYSNQAFFPLDGMGWGNEGHDHNFHFTFELHTKFLYAGGEKFHFTGDDDLWTFINGKLAINLGGVHGAEDGDVDLDQMAAALGLEKGKTYPLDFFFAERHTSQSTFRIDTTLAFTDCGSPVPQ